ncbi:M48 family metalloprotease [Halovenus sp. WSH3]|uniref:M48 family metalloprotease n=2 Tax=Halovenus carboxidivorans TaxID=2692199 RepID=A0A6B0T844_9EURY|nr:M48 family metalloprotease [Halovenus carboxidivorans]
MVLVGVATLIVYTGVALLGFAVIEWVAANPPNPLTIVLVFAIVALFGAYLGYRRGVVRLAASLNARELPRHRAPSVYRRFDRLCAEMSVTQPPLLLASLDSPNALSVGGPRRGAIVIDRRLLRLLSPDELEGILAHELAHMEQYDTFINTFAVTLTRLLAGIVYLLLLPILLVLLGIDRAASWIAGEPRQRGVGLADLFQYGIGIVLAGLLSVFTLLFLAHSRRQEYRADRRAADVTGKPDALARALSKIHRATESHRGLQSLLYTHDDRRRPHRLLSTHPPLEERIERLLGEDARRRRSLGPAAR